MSLQKLRLQTFLGLMKFCLLIAIVLIFSVSEATASITPPGIEPEYASLVGGETLIPPGRDRESRLRQINLLIRSIGHRLLLQSGDWTSRVLPVSEVKEGTFLLSFEKDLVFSHDSLITMSEQMFPKTHFPSGYTVTVLDCMRAEIIYGFQINSSTPDIIACRGRREPIGCYVIEFDFPDFYEAEPVEKEISLPAEEPKTAKAERQKLNVKHAEVTVNNIVPQIALVETQEQSSIVGQQAAQVKPAQYETTNSDFQFIKLASSSMLVLLGVTMLLGRFGKIETLVPRGSQQRVISNALDVELTSLGKFQFDVKGQRLLSGAEVVSLTDKECRILELLNEDFGELVPREMLMQKIWLDEGVITGRSLDMFVSKLRKKLSGDPDLRITNVHGKGYKLEVHAIHS